MTEISAFLLSEAETTDPNSPLGDGLVSNNFDDLTTTSLEPSMFDDANDPYLSQPIFDDSELASNDFCLLPTSPASRKAKSRKRAAVNNECSPDDTSTSPNAPTLRLPTPEEVEELLEIQSPLQKKWCSESVTPGFSNIPVCRKDKVFLQGFVDDQIIPEALRTISRIGVSSLYQIYGRIRKRNHLLHYTSRTHMSFSFSFFFLVSSPSANGLKKKMMLSLHIHSLAF